MVISRTAFQDSMSIHTMWIHRDKRRFDYIVLTLWRRVIAVTNVQSHLSTNHSLLSEFPFPYISEVQENTEIMFNVYYTNCSVYVSTLVLHPNNFKQIISFTNKNTLVIEAETKVLTENNSFNTSPSPYPSSCNTLHIILLFLSHTRL